MLRNILNKVTLNENEMYLHKKKVPIAKLTPVKWQQLFNTVDRLPGLIIQVMTAPSDNFYNYVIQAIDLALTEIVDVVSVLTDIDSDYINNNVGLDELIEYLHKVVKLNRLDTIPKNVKSLLPKRNQ